MRPFRFSILQLLLAATLVGLVLGLVTSAWRSSSFQSIEEVCFSPDGKRLAARYSGGAVQVWRLDSKRPKLVAQAFGREGFFSGYFSSIHFIASDKLLKIDSQFFPAVGIKVRQLDLNSHQVVELAPIGSAFLMRYGDAANAERIVLADTGTSTVAAYSLQTGRLERKWTLPSMPWKVDMSADGNVVAICGVERQVHIMSFDDDAPPRKLEGTAPLALSHDGRIIVTTSPDRPGSVFIHEASALDSPLEVPFDLMRIGAMTMTGDDARLVISDGTNVEYYDVAAKTRLRRIEINDPAPGDSIASVLSPAGDWLANTRGSDIVLYDLAHGNERHLLGGDLRLLEILIFTLGFAAWSIVWGIVAKRARLKQPVTAVAALPALAPAAARPVPSMIAWKWQLPWAVTTICLSLCLIAALQVTAGQSLGTVFFDIVQLTAFMLGAAMLVVVVISWIAFFTVGPHRMTLNRLRRIAGDPGRLVRCGRLTFWFAASSRLESEYQKQLDEILTNAEDLLGRSVEPKQRRLIACLDRQCDLDAYFGRHVPLAALIPWSLFDRVAMVCDETAVRQLVRPEQALRLALAFSILIEQKRGYLPGWVAALLAQQITRDVRRPAELRAAIRRLKVLLIRYPQWDPKEVFHRTTRERFQLLLASEERSSWLEVRAENDFLLTLGEMLLGPDAPVDLRQKSLAWLRAVSRKDDPLATFERDVGLSLDALLAQWRNWLATRSGLFYDPLPAESRWLLRDVALPTISNPQLPTDARQRMVRQLGVSCVAAAPALMELLADSKIELRREAAEALEFLSGEAFGDDAARWQAWWQSLPAHVRGEPVPLARMVAAAVGDQPAESAAPVVTSPARTLADAGTIPAELKLCWGLMVGSGLIALLIPISLVFVMGPIVFPMMYYSLFVGVATMSRGAARDTAGLLWIAGLQMANLMVCDPINMVAGGIERLLLGRPNVRQYLLLANGGRL